MQRPENDPELEAPPELIQALRRLDRPAGSVPNQVDERILTAAQRHLQRDQPTRTWAQWLSVPRLAWVSSGVAILVALGWWLVPSLRIGSAHFSRSSATQTSDQAAAATRPRGLDINGDTVIDILDALELAQRIEASPSLDSALDVNGDGHVDGADAEFIARFVVRLKRDQPSQPGEKG